MYDPILLALDGSELAERALPHAVALARQFGARLLLVRVVPPVVQPLGVEPGFSPASGYAQVIEAESAAARAYVDHLAQRLQQDGITVEALTPLGEPAASILEVAAERGAGLIVMATHGRSGLSRLVFGSVAERVLREASVPLLLVRARPSSTPNS